MDLNKILDVILIAAVILTAAAVTITIVILKQGGMI